MDYAGRLYKLQSTLAAKGLDSVVYGTGGNIFYFTGASVMWRREHEPTEPDSFLVVAKKGTPTLLVRENYVDIVSEAPIEVLTVASEEEMAAKLGSLVHGHVGVGPRALSYVQALLGQVNCRLDSIVSDSSGEEMRVIKDADEIALMRKIAGLTDDVLAKVVPIIKKGSTQLDIQAGIVKYVAEAGGTNLSFNPRAGFVKSGSTPGKELFVYPMADPIAPGCSIAFDFGMIYDGYCSDFGRSFYYGKAPEQFLGAYQALQEAQVNLINSIKPGVTKINEFWGILEDKLDHLGYGDRLRARHIGFPGEMDKTFGHQIGIDVHENPWIKPISDITVEPGMIMCIEPKVWWPGEYYLRVEDIVLITEDGAESLTKYSREQFELPL